MGKLLKFIFIWPFQALMVWFFLWLIYFLLIKIDFSPYIATVISGILGIFFSIIGSTLVRKILISTGFPIAIIFYNSFSPWIWLVPFFVLVSIYPINAWKDAPFFPTPRNALKNLFKFAPLKEGACVLDIGSGLGHGLKALKLSYPNAVFFGIEKSFILRISSYFYCPWANIKKGDMWEENWKNYDLIYIFQRPETMPKAILKASKELKKGSWLVSLEFNSLDIVPHAVINTNDGKFVWLYQTPFKKSSLK
mgnify:CR=1 FL=1|tara:strand:- start:183 stop:935 length:753 start_codon:yes stop_codon:yes gene_type:complete